MTAPAPKSPSTVLPVRVHSDETPTPQSKASGDRAAKGAQEVDEEYNPEDFEEVTGPSDAAKNAGAVEVELGMSSKEPSAGVGTATVDRYRDCIAVLFPPSWPSPEAMAEYAQTIRVISPRLFSQVK